MVAGGVTVPGAVPMVMMTMMMMMVMVMVMMMTLIPSVILKVF